MSESGRGAAWLACLLWEQEVGGSNPPAPTTSPVMSCKSVSPRHYVKSVGRRCGRCGTTKPEDDFAWRRLEKKQRDNYCRSCRAAYKREHYARNRQRYIDNAAARRRRMLDERMRFLIDYLRRNPCADCGETDIVVLEFDHRGDKEFDIAQGIRSRNWDSVLAEIAKCDVVCANCHRRRTAKRASSLRSRLLAEGSPSRSDEDQPCGHAESIH